MTRYARQPHEYSCGPTAIINAIKWAGYPCPVREYHTFLARLCESDYEQGTDEMKFDGALRQITKGFIRVRKRNRPTIGMLTEHLERSDCAIIMLYYWKEENLVETVLPGVSLTQAARWFTDAGLLDVDPEAFKHRFCGHYALLTDADGDGYTGVNMHKHKTVATVKRAIFEELVTNDPLNPESFPMAWLLRRYR